MYVLSSFHLTSWGKVTASARVEFNPYYTPGSPSEPKYLMEQVEVRRPDGRNFFKALLRHEVAQVEEMLAESFEITTEAECLKNHC